ncbi:hypothetical protein CUB90_19910 [Clostridium sp. CT7]|nr:hypothetical protein CUB90_19910 [Clostridium sp. CT7]
MNKEVTLFIIKFLKCFLILIIFGILLPEIADKIITYIVEKKNINSNSYFVYNIFNYSKQFIIKYIYYFRICEGYN